MKKSSIAAPGFPELSARARMPGGFGGIGLAGYRRKAATFAA